MQQRRPIHRALLSVSNEADIVEFAQTLSARGVELLSTGDTVRLLTEKGLPVAEVPGYAGFPEMMDGRMKALYPKVHGGIPGRHSQDDAIMEEHRIQLIDMVVVNLYPFAQIMAHEGYSLRDAVKSIDIDNPAMMCSAAKNHKDITIVVKSSDYDAIIKEMDDSEGSLTLATRFDLAIKTFKHAAIYDSMIASYFGSMVPAYHGESKEAAGRFPRMLNLDFIKKLDMRYGENSHQQAAFYIEENVKKASVITATQVQGKALSYNSIIDTDTALECVKEFVEPACVTVKHANPCGVTIGNSILDAYDRAYKAGPTSAFDGIIAFNRELDAETTQAIISRQFVEVIIVPSAGEEALKVAAAKQSVRALTCGQWDERVPSLDFKRVNGGLLVQDRDLGMVSAEELRVVTKRQPSEQELCNALFCWKVAKFVRSNTIVYAKNNVTVDISAGQMSRVYSTEITDIKAADESLEVKGSSMASDAFFPSHGGIDAAAAAGVTCVIQPGGSTRNDEVIAAADEHGIAMLFIDMHHLRH